MDEWWDKAYVEAEIDMIDGIEMPVESLDQEPRADIPQGNSLVSRGCGEDVGEGLEGHKVWRGILVHPGCG